MFADLLTYPFTAWTALGLIMLFIIIGFLTASLAMMFQVFQQPNMIFYPWAVLLAHISKKGEMWRHLMRPFGRCRYCNGIWITIYAFKLMFGVHWLILLALGSNFIFVWLLDHYVIPNVEPNTKVDTLYHIEFKHAQTPWQAMMRSYAVLGIFYAFIYIALPIIF
jgi:hypothetical protein